MKQPNLQWLRDMRQINGDELNSVDVKLVDISATKEAMFES